MKTEVQVRSTELAAALETYLERRLGFALEPFRGRIRQVTLRIVELPRRKGGAAKRCEITADLLPAGRVSASELHNDQYVAVDRALRKLVRFLRKAPIRKVPGGENADECFRAASGGASLPGIDQGGLYAGAEG